MFEKFGLLYGVQIYPYHGQGKKTSANTTECSVKPGNASGYYGFVTFYSTRDTHRAKESLNNRIYIFGSECKVSKPEMDIVCSEF